MHERIWYFYRHPCTNVSLHDVANNQQLGTITSACALSVQTCEPDPHQKILVVSPAIVYDNRRCRFLICDNEIFSKQTCLPDMRKASE